MKYTRKLSASLAIAATMSIGIGMPMTQAVAETVPVLKAADQTGNFTVHKFAVANDREAGEPNAGGAALDADPANAKPVEGVEYTIQLLKGSPDKIRTQEGMKELAKIASDLKANPALTVETEGDPIVMKTNASGIAEFTNIKQGAYLVKETSVADAKIDGTKSEKALVAGPAFIAFIPTTTEDGSAYNYDVNAYPKNSTLGLKKEFSNLETMPQSGDILSYKVTADIPKVGVDGTITKYNITDKIPNQVSYQEVKSITVGGDKLTADTDYTAELSGETLTITFKDTGLAKLAEKQASTDKVVVDIDTKVKEAIVDGITQNTATVIFNNGSGNGDTTVDANTPEGPSYAKLKLTKTDDKETNKKLGDATFELHWCTDGAVATDKPDPIKSLVTDKDHTTSFYQGSVTTNDEGVATFEGLQKLDSTDAHKYCLVETKAPAGYAKRPDPIVIDGFTKDGTFEANLSLAANVTNIKNPDANLPGTGGSGKNLLLFGLIVAALAAGGYAVSRTKTAE